MAFKRLIPLMLLALWSSLATAEEALLDQSTRDWFQVGSKAQSQGVPVLLLVSSEDCGYCELLKREVLNPMLRNGELKGRAMVREMDLNTGGKIVDFDGEKVRAGIFLSRHKVFATPTLLFLSPDGSPLHDPLVGYNGTELYPPLLERALHESHAALEQIDGNTRVAKN